MDPGKDISAHAATEHAPEAGGAQGPLPQTLAGLPAAPSMPEVLRRDTAGKARAGEDAERETAHLWRVAGLGGELFAAIAAAGALGWLADKWLGTAHRWMSVGLVVGVVGGMVAFVRKAVAIGGESDGRKERRR